MINGMTPKKWIQMKCSYEPQGTTLSPLTEGYICCVYDKDSVWCL